MRRIDLHRHLLFSTSYQKLLTFLKSIRIRRGDATLYSTINVFMGKLGQDQIFEKANAVAFSFTLAMFPSIIFLFTLIPFIHNIIPEVDTQQIMDFLEVTLPENMYAVTASTLEDIIGIKRGGLLSFGVLFALFLATNGVNTLMQAFNNCYKTKEKRSFLTTRLIATGITIMLAFVLLLALVLLVVGQFVIDWLFSFGMLTEDLLYYTLLLVRLIIVLVTFFLAISLIYYLAPAIHDRWRFFSSGSFMAAVICVALSFGFAIYINNFATYNKVYGSIGVLIALMVWLFMLSAVLLMGFEWNASADLAARLNQSKSSQKNS
ncbi:MAG: YihY/virulence factor BrkB family protein [Cyclobacteriaceae bacterium]